MSKRNILLFLGLLVGFSIMARMVPHPPNFTPIAALALFAAVYASKISKWYLITPLAAMALSDLFVGFYEPKTMAVVYASFFATGLFGLLARKAQSGWRIASVGLATLLGSLLFFLATNAAVWAFSGMYAPTFDGLMLSYAMALPFLKFTLLGNLFYVSLFFGIFELATSLTQKYTYGPTTPATATTNPD